LGEGDWPGAQADAVEHEEKGGHSADEAISVDSLRSGIRLSQDVYDADTDVLLLAAGVQVTPRFLQLLSSRGIKAVKLKTPEGRSGGGASVQSSSTERLDAILQVELRKKISFFHLSADERPRLGLSDLKAEAARGVEQHAKASGVVLGLCDNLTKGRGIAGQEIRETLSSFAAQATLDVDLLPLIVSLQKSGDEYLFDHCLNVALLSMSIATQAGLERDLVMEVAFGALLQDIGMLQVPNDLRLAPRALTSGERFEITRHPVHTLDWLDRIDGVPLTTRFIGYQSHERVDGKGYPRRRAGMFVHQFAKLVGIADSFAAMTRPRPYRQAFIPYEAAKAILEDKGKFDRLAVRVFLDTVGLFPIGSFVELDSGIKGKVVRANPGAHTRPIVEEVDSAGRPSGQLIDLARETEMAVASAIPRPA
jgi:HD-GYP domain-containing protein (c-di-GMP phosphodiesterase class II)